MSPNDLDQIAHSLITEKINQGEVVNMHWAVTELIDSQGMIHGDGVPFYSLCAQEHAYRVVKKAVDKYDKPQAGDDLQMILEGYEYLQEAYTVDRDGQRQLVPIQLVSNGELLGRAREFRKQAAGLSSHAEELERYVKTRAIEPEVTEKHHAPPAHSTAPTQQNNL